MKNPTKAQKVLLWTLFALYILLMIWIILLKRHFSFAGLVQERAINLVPFYYNDAGIVYGIQITELLANVAVFFPYGVYLATLKGKLKWGYVPAIIVGTSFLFECLQWAFSIGVPDITDLITNTVGGLLGMAVWGLLYALCRNKEKRDWLIAALASAGTLALLGYLLLMHRIHR
ncbi:MAG: VanZ family protein [Oscillospiraceae bacterium]|jgi:glycopeptide antibiotics resistance protein|nr:VanZ family protein [Oscillospiraceae bacterium]